MYGLILYVIPPIIPTISNIIKVKSETRIALSFAAPSAIMIRTREFSRSPMPPIDIGSMAIIVTTGTINKKEANPSSIPRALAAR